MFLSPFLATPACVHRAAEHSTFAPRLLGILKVLHSTLGVWGDKDKLKEKSSSRATKPTLHFATYHAALRHVLSQHCPEFASVAYWLLSVMRSHWLLNSATAVKQGLSTHAIDEAFNDTAALFVQAKQDEGLLKLLHLAPKSVFRPHDAHVEGVRRGACVEPHRRAALMSAPPLEQVSPSGWRSRRQSCWRRLRCTFKAVASGRWRRTS